jgi:deoxyribodipyrimidine photo-lyase
MQRQLVWLKRDLRLGDHPPLAAAAVRGPVLVLYVFDPAQWGQPTYHRRHFEFVLGSLREFESGLRERGGALLVRVGEPARAIAALHEAHPITALWSHQETGDAMSWAADRAVVAWARSAGVVWHEARQGGVVRRLASRDGWAERWQVRMSKPLVATPAIIAAPPGLGPTHYPTAEEVGVKGLPLTSPQTPGEAAGQASLASFLGERGRDYRASLGLPAVAESRCSRISPYLAWGAISARQAYQAARERRVLEQNLVSPDKRWLASLASFEARLAWRCHFMQKLEDEPALERRALCRTYAALREGAFNEARFEAWRAGQTGFPLVDACMRSVAETGWLTFRMRAMVTAFAAYDLWLPWERTAAHLAAMFLDYEPGIHYPQIQMQSGTTGINTLRMYDVTKQAREQDPAGLFIRRWVSELANVPDEHLAAPHAMPPLLQLAAGFRSGIDYPAPMVERKAAIALARTAYAAVRADPLHAQEVDRVLVRHGSRRSGNQRVFHPGL